MSHQLLSFFSFQQLPEHLQRVSRPFCELATAIDNSLADSAEKTAALRKLLESKDCAVRAALSAPRPEPVIYDESDASTIVHLAHDRYTDTVLEATSLAISVGPIIDPPAKLMTLEEAADRMSHYNAAIMILQGQIAKAQENPEDKIARLSRSIYETAGRLRLGDKEDA